MKLNEPTRVKYSCRNRVVKDYSSYNSSLFLASFTYPREISRPQPKEMYKVVDGITLRQVNQSEYLPEEYSRLQG